MAEKLRRDRLTIYCYITLLSYVWALYGVGPALLLLRDEHDYTRTVAALHSVSLSAGIVALGLIGERITGRFGRARSVEVGSVLVAGGMLLLIFGPSAAFSIPGAFLIGFGGSMLTNPMNAFLTLYHRDHGPAAIAESNAGAAFAGLIAPLFMGALVALDINWRFALLTGLALFAIGRVLRGDGTALNLEAPPHEHAHTRLPGLYWWGWLSLALCIGAEFCFVFWAGDLLRDRAQVSTAVATAGLSAVAIGMMLSRIASSQLLRHFSMQRLFVISIALALVMWAPMWVFANATVMLASMFVIGIGIGAHFPIGMSRMLASAPGMLEEAAARSSLAAGLAGGAMPFVLGMLGDAFGIHAAFGLVPMLFGLALVIALWRPVRATA